MTSILPRLILPNGEINREWTEAYIAQFRCTRTTANLQRQAAIVSMPEPSLVTSSGKLSKTWVTWYKVCKRVSTNIAISTGRALIKERECENDSTETPKHRTYYW